MRHLIPKFIVALWLVLPVGQSFAQHGQPATIRFVPKRDLPTDQARLIDNSHVEIYGEIAPDSPQRLRLALDEARGHADQFSLGGQPVVRVFLNSPGGNVFAAIAMGRTLRAYAAEVWVDRGQTCASACILVLAGGVSRWAVPPSRLGVHRPYFDQKLFAGLSYEQSQKKYAVLARDVKDYLAEMGVADELYQTMMKIPSNNIRFLDDEDAERTGLLGNDPAHEEWEHARAVQRQGGEFMKNLDRYTTCINEGSTDRQCSKYLKPTAEPK